jgi:TetR/AcrR family transcriptional regulator
VASTAALSPIPADGDDVRRRILDAAEAVFAERGYAGATTREMAARAGIGKRMLFYYFPNKAALYRTVLDRIIGGMAAIHEAFRGEPGPVGLADVIEGVTHFAAQNLCSLKILVREIMDGGPYLPEIARERIQPLFVLGQAEVARNMTEGIFQPSDPMHVLLSVGGITLHYFLTLPLLRLTWDRDPLAPETLAERAAVTRDLLLYGLLTPAARKAIAPPSPARRRVEATRRLNR